MQRKILYIPLDERPCNYSLPQHMLMYQDDVQLLMPPQESLGNKKAPAHLPALYEFVEQHIHKADDFIFSVEMLMYGGLLPSRIHHLQEEHKIKFFDWLRKLKVNHQNIRFYASNLIMRTPKYSSSDEEPEYYEIYGEAIFREAYLKDKRQRVGLDALEQETYEALVETTPRDVIDDYENRRAYNVKVNLSIIDLMKEGIIDCLVIPQDDSSQYGYTAIDQSVVYRRVKDLRLQSKVHIYPGADEVGCALVSKAIRYNCIKKVHVLFSSYHGPSIIPLYEDRPIMNSLLLHLQVSNARLVPTLEEADIVLAYNTPGLACQEASSQTTKDITYDSYRNMTYFADSIANAIAAGKRVMLADCAYANGGDIELIKLLDELSLLDKLYVYNAWNTNCNTLGTTLAHGLLEISEQNRIYNLLYHIYDDALYQSIIRKHITDKVLPDEGLNYFDLKNRADNVARYCEKGMEYHWESLIYNSFYWIEKTAVQVKFPWNRMFEIDLTLHIQNK